jgi:hypothetical protein
VDGINFQRKAEGKPPLKEVDLPKYIEEVRAAPGMPRYGSHDTFWTREFINSLPSHLGFPQFKTEEEFEAWVSV